MKKILLSIFLVSFSFLQGEIVETQSFKEISSYLSPGTLVILDIDDTLLVPVQMLGCDEWFQSRARYHQNAGMLRAEGFEKSIAEWEAIRHLTKMETVEPGTPEIVKSLQDQGFQVMCLTTQGLALATRTMQQLQGHAIDLTRSSPSPNDCYFLVDGHGVLYRGGTLYTSGTHKGKALFRLLEIIGVNPKRVLFLNDKLPHLKPIEEIANLKCVEYIGLRYAYSDSRKGRFDEKIANYQFEHSSFAHILSDEEARSQLGVSCH